MMEIGNCANLFKGRTNYFIHAGNTRNTHLEIVEATRETRTVICYNARGGSYFQAVYKPMKREKRGSMINQDCSHGEIFPGGSDASLRKFGESISQKVITGHVILKMDTIVIPDSDENIYALDEGDEQMHIGKRLRVPPLDPSPSSHNQQVVVPKEFPKVSMGVYSLKELKRHLVGFDQEQGLVLAALKNELRKLKGKALDKEAIETHYVDPKVSKDNMEPITPKLLNKRTGHSSYIKHTQEEALVLRDIGVKPFCSARDTAFSAIQGIVKIQQNTKL
ncbi:hypothetical protein Tco_0108803 [Tanacetum coccineum]